MSAQEDRAHVSRPEDARHSNHRIADRAERFRFVSRVPMLCECSDPDCQRLFLIELAAYRKVPPGCFLTVPGHSVDEHEPTTRTDEYWQHASGISSLRAP